MMKFCTERGLLDLEEIFNNFTAHASDDLQKAIDDLVDEYADTATTQRRALLQASSSAELESSWSVTDDMTSDSWQAMESLMISLQGVLPTVIDDIKFASKEVSKVASTLSTIFAPLGIKAPPIFYDVSDLYKTLWVVYFILFVVLTLLVLFYAFWAQGFFGGPTPGVPSPEYKEGCCSGTTFRQRCSTCWNSCTSCMRNIQDKQMCFWSCILFSEVIILVMFAVSILMSVLAALKAFLGLGCGQVYVLGDVSVCSSIISGLQTSFPTFWEGFPTTIQDACGNRHLPACQAITDTLQQSITFTVIGAFAATLLSLQLLFLSAQLHERALWTRKFMD
jgi:hypothetical protein